MRERLPNRRFHEIIRVQYQAGETEGVHVELLVDIGRYPDGRIGEVFTDAQESNSTLQRLLADASTIISIALQHGIPPEALNVSLGRVRDGRPASAIGVIMDTLVEETS
ncbi:hypothetical protein LCGC14_0355500 [marine sediment metagenome]|uniref:ribonucleoside-diphosphate reductase n=1 Tax=marine sediment metagenome TaxID=412755 RepID=A0A0F9T9T6_9ZZZZ